MHVGVYIQSATSVEDANAQCKKLQAYFQILEQYPSSRFDRRHVKTAPHDARVMIADGKPRAWYVEFEVKPKQGVSTTQQLPLHS